MKSASAAKTPPPPAFVHRLGEEEKNAVHKICAGFVPDRLFDLHAHLLRASHFPEAVRPNYLNQDDVHGADSYSKTVEDFFGQRKWSGLFFGFPAKGNNPTEINSWVKQEIQSLGEDSAALMLCKPDSDPQSVAAMLEAGAFSGLKPYHTYAHLPTTNKAPIEAFAPEWMWEACHATKSVIMLHIMRDHGISDPDNCATLRRFLTKYPHCHVVLAHVAGPLIIDAHEEISNGSTSFPMSGLIPPLLRRQKPSESPCKNWVWPAFVTEAISPSVISVEKL